MKNLQSVLVQQDVQKEVNKVKRTIRGEEESPEVDGAVDYFLKNIVNLIGAKHWGKFLGRSNRWEQDLRWENMEFFNENNQEEVAAKLGKGLSHYLREDEERGEEIKNLLLPLASKIMFDARLAIHNLAPPENKSPGTGDAPHAEAANLELR